MRLSDRFLLLDFLYDQSTLDCVANCGDKLRRAVASLNERSEAVEEGRYLCTSILERIVENHGPISIAAGLWFKHLPYQSNAHHGTGPHVWNKDKGAAADIVVHSWVNQEKAPKYFLKRLPGSDIEYQRTIPYTGSEFCCVASKSTGNKYKSGCAKWDTLNDKAKKGLFDAQAVADWRRQPYTHSHGSKLKRETEYGARLKAIQALWSEQRTNETDNSAVATVTFGRQPPGKWPALDHSIVEVPEGAIADRSDEALQLVRPWHVRVSRYFVLFDFCRNEKVIERGVVTVPPLALRTANSVIKVARMFGEVLDPLKHYLGNVSVVRGMEPQGFADDPFAERYRWLPGEGRIHSVELLTPKNPMPGYLDSLDHHRCTAEVRPDPVYGGDRITVSVRDFQPRACYTSATGQEYPWSS